MDFGTVRQKILPAANLRVHAPSLAAEPRPWCLLQVSGPGAGERFLLGDAALIGREGQVEIKLPATSVSRRHCHLWRKRGSYWVADLGATNPTLVNAMLIRATPLFDGDMLSVGDYILKLLAPDNPENDAPLYELNPDFKDPLTGLRDRHAFRLTALSLWQGCPADSSIALFVFDIDHFKHVIDRFGAVAGDRVLAQVGRIMRDQARGLELPGRIGGEEFAVLLPGASKADALRAAERLRLSLAALQLLQDGEPLLITASFGVAATRIAEGNLEALYGRADAALHEAKRQGRNRVLSLPDA